MVPSPLVARSRPFRLAMRRPLIGWTGSSGRPVKPTRSTQPGPTLLAAAALPTLRRQQCAYKSSHRSVRASSWAKGLRTSRCRLCRLRTDRQTMASETSRGSRGREAPETARSCVSVGRVCPRMVLAPVRKFVIKAGSTRHPPIAPRRLCLIGFRETRVGG